MNKVNIVLYFNTENLPDIVATVQIKYGHVDTKLTFTNDIPKALHTYLLSVERYNFLFVDYKNVKERIKKLFDANNSFFSVYDYCECMNILEERRKFNVICSNS